MVPSALVPYLLTQWCGTRKVIKTSTDRGSLTTTVTTYTKVESELESTLEIVQDMETPKVKQAGIQCLVWSLRSSSVPVTNQWNWRMLLFRAWTQTNSSGQYFGKTRVEIVSIKGLDNNFMSNKSNNKYYSASVLRSPSFTEELILKSFLPALYGITRWRHFNLNCNILSRQNVKSVWASIKPFASHV